MTAEHWGEEARTKVEGDEWQGLYWQSHALTQRHIDRAIAGGSEENWLNFTKRRFFPRRGRLALSLGCGYGILERHAIAVDIAERFEAFDISPEAVEVARREAELVGTATGSPTRRRTQVIELAPGSLRRRFCGPDAPSHRGSRATARPDSRFATRDGLFVVNEYVGPVRFQFPEERLPLMNKLLLALPETHRRSLRTGKLKDEVVRPNEKEVQRSTPPNRSARTRSSA